MSDEILDKYLKMYQRDYIVDIILTSVCCLLLLGMLWILYKVYSIIKFKNLPIILMLVFMILSVVALINFFMVNLLFNKMCANDLQGEHHVLSSLKLTIVPLLPVLLFATAILINLDIWIYMYIKV